MADPTAGGGTEGLRAALAQIIDPKALEIMGRSGMARHERWAVLAESIAYRKADALIAGPLADFLARASAERDEARRQRMPHMCRDDHPEIRHAVSDDDERCPVCRERDRADQAERERARFEAENAGLRAVLRAVLPPKILGEGQERRGSEDFHMTMTWDALKRARAALREPQPTPEAPDA